MASVDQSLSIAYISAMQLGAPDAANNHTMEICNHLAQRGHSIYLFIPRSTVDYEKPENIQIIMSPAFGRVNSLFWTFSFYLFLPFSAWNYFSHLKPNVLYTRFSFLEFLTVLPMCLRFKFMHVSEINGIRSLESQGMKLKRRIISRLERLSLNLCDAVIAVTLELSEWVSEKTRLPQDKITVIGNGVAVDRFSPRDSDEVCRLLKLNPEVIYLNFTGSLKPWHGTKIIIEALPHIITASRRKIQLLVVGDGPEKENLKFFSKQLGVEEAILWVGRIPNDQVPDYINASTICLAPITPNENIGVGRSSLKLFEYLSCGKPIITTRIGAAYDNLIIEGGFGLLVPPDDKSAMAEAILELLNDPDKAKAMGKCGRQVVLDYFSWEKIAEQTESFLRRQLITRNR